MKKLQEAQTASRWKQPIKNRKKHRREHQSYFSCTLTQFVVYLHLKHFNFSKKSEVKRIPELETVFTPQRREVEDIKKV